MAWIACSSKLCSFQNPFCRQEAAEGSKLKIGWISRLPGWHSQRQPRQQLPVQHRRSHQA